MEYDDFVVEAAVQDLRSIHLISYLRSPEIGRLPFKPVQMMDYAKTWCKKGNDCPIGQYDDENNSDCTHFVAHALSAGGATVAGSSAQCPNGLCIRVKDLAAALHNGSTQFKNVQKILRLEDARTGDICVLKRFSQLKTHAMILNGRPNKDGCRIFGHSENRCGEFVKFDTSSCVYFRIEEAEGEPVQSGPGNNEPSLGTASKSFALPTITWYDLATHTIPYYDEIDRHFVISASGDWRYTSRFVARNVQPSLIYFMDLRCLAQSGETLVSIRVCTNYRLGFGFVVSTAGTAKVTQSQWTAIESAVTSGEGHG